MRRFEKVWYKTKRNEKKTKTKKREKAFEPKNLKQPTSLFQAMLWVEAREPETGYSRCEERSFQPGTEGRSRT